MYIIFIMNKMHIISIVQRTPIVCHFIPCYSVLSSTFVCLGHFQVYYQMKLKMDQVKTTIDGYYPTTLIEKVSQGTYAVHCSLLQNMHVRVYCPYRVYTVVINV